MAGIWSRHIWHGPSTAAYWSGVSAFADTDFTETTDDRTLQWSTVSLIFDRTTPTNITEDVAVTSLSVYLPSGGPAISVLQSSDKADVEARLDTWFTSFKAQVSSHYTLREYRWHDYMLSWTKPGPATRVTTKGTACTGSATNTLPDQVATSITHKTASRAHWGRNYWPALVSTAYDTTGRITSAQVDSRSGDWRTLLNGIATDGQMPCVASSVHGGVLDIVELQMDNTPDVIRSRRAKRPSYRKSYTS